MNTRFCPSASVFLRLALPGLFLGLAFASVAHGQAAAEAAGATSVAAGAASSVKAPNFPAMPSGGSSGSSTAGTNASGSNKSPHLASTAGPAPEVANRRNLEQKAGPDAAKLLLRSTPSASNVWIDGFFVGKTPMLLVVAPGKYRVEMKGPRQETDARNVNVLPRETREISSTLSLHYPTRVTVRR